MVNNSSFPVPEKGMKLIGGELQFILDSTVSSENGYKPVQGCWPSSYFDDGSGNLTLSPEGEIKGGCQWISPSSRNPQIDWNNFGELHGSYEEKSGKVTFSLVTLAEYPENGTKITISYSGEGYFISKYRAEGLATYISICQSLTSILNCGVDVNNQKRSSWEITGDVPWILVFEP